LESSFLSTVSEREGKSSGYIASTRSTRQGEPEKKGKRWSYPGPNSIGFETFIGKEFRQMAKISWVKDK